MTSFQDIASAIVHSSDSELRAIRQFYLKRLKVFTSSQGRVAEQTQQHQRSRSQVRSQDC